MICVSKNSRRRTTSLFQWLVVGDKGTQKMRDYKTFEGFFTLSSFVSCFCATFAHIIILALPYGKDNGSEHGNNGLVSQ